MSAYLVLLLAVLSRFLPHAFHGVGLNITAVNGGLLYFGAKRPRWQIAIAVLVMALSDVYLTCFVYSYPFHVTAYLVTWLWYGAVGLIGSGLLREVSLLRIGAAVLSSASGFFLLSNFEVWASSGLYPHSAAGMASCYFAALPFYSNDLVSTGLTGSILFGLPIASRHLVRAFEHGTDFNVPLA